MTYRVEIVGRERCRLGESPLWDPDIRALFWVDSVACRVWRYDPATGEQTHFPAPEQIGSIVLGRPGELIAGLESGVFRLNLATSAFTRIVRPDALTAAERLNDGKTDRSGRFVTGSLTVGHAAEPAGKLYRFNGGARWEVIPTDTIAISNSICFSPEGDTLYFADSLKQMVWAFDYDPATGAVGARRDLIDTAAMSSAPDGATVDADGFIWIALVQAQKLARFAPDGRLDRVLESPAPFPSCPAFGGDDLATLFVTSISNSGGQLVSDADAAGRLIAFHDLGVRGIAETRCRL